MNGRHREVDERGLVEWQESRRATRADGLRQNEDGKKELEGDGRRCLYDALVDDEVVGLVVVESELSRGDLLDLVNSPGITHINDSVPSAINGS